MQRRTAEKFPSGTASSSRKNSWPGRQEGSKIRSTPAARSAGAASWTDRAEGSELRRISAAIIDHSDRSREGLTL
jgi:hypothetical protein